MIATYALCGFSNPSSIGIMIGGLVTLAPEKRSAITEVAFRAFIAGSATCFLTASMAGRYQTDFLLLSSSSPDIISFLYPAFAYYDCASINIISQIFFENVEHDILGLMLYRQWTAINILEEYSDFILSMKE
jgi:hypothetical protein